MAIRVPATLPISLLDVWSAVSDHTSTTKDLNSCFANANPLYFDPMYNIDSYAPPMSQLRFRNYGPPLNPPTYFLSYTVDNTAVVPWYEGQSITIKLQTTNVPNGTQFTLTIDSAHTTDASFASTTAEQSSTIITVQNNIAFVTCYGMKDIWVETMETVIFSLTLLNTSTVLSTLTTYLHNPGMSVILSPDIITTSSIGISWVTHGISEEVINYAIWRGEGASGTSAVTLIANVSPVPGMNTHTYTDYSVISGAPYRYYIVASRYGTATDIISNTIYGYAGLVINWHVKTYTCYKVFASSKYYLEVVFNATTNCPYEVGLQLGLSWYNAPVGQEVFKVWNFNGLIGAVVPNQNLNDKDSRYSALNNTYATIGISIKPWGIKAPGTTSGYFGFTSNTTDSSPYPEPYLT